MMDGLVQDVRYALRLMGRRRGYAAIVVLTLGLGIGAITAVFSIVDAVLLRLLPYRDPSRLVAVWLRNTHETGTSKLFDSLRDFRAFKRARSFAQTAVATWAVGGRVLRGYGPAQEILALPVSETFLGLLGVAPAMGRAFAAEDLKRGCSVVVSDQMWRGALAADRAIVGKSITLGDRPCSVLGVMPRSFEFYPTAAQAWILLTPDFSPPPEKIPLGIFARLRDGVSIEQAEAEVSTIHAALNKSDGEERDMAPMVRDLHGEFTFLAEARLRATLWILLAAVSFVLLIVCLNVANLMAGQAYARERELAVWAALGSGRGRLARQLLTEGLLLASGGGAAGLAVAFAAIRLFRAMAPVEMPPGADVQMSWPALLFAGVISLATAALFSALPAWRASRVDAIGSLRVGRGGASAAPQRTMRALIGAEAALSLVLLAAAGLLMQSALRMGSEPLGFERSGLVTARVSLPAERYPTPESRARFYERTLAALGDRAALSTSLPPYLLPSAAVRIAGVESSGSRYTGEQSVSPGYFRTMGERLARGREFTERDGASSEPVVIVNEALARRDFGNLDAIGRRIALGDASAANPWLTVVGVVADEKRLGGFDRVGWAAAPMAFRPIVQDPQWSASIVARGTGAGVRPAVASVDQTLAVCEVETMDARLGRTMAYPRFRAALLSAFAVFAVLLAAIGLYGTLGQFVAQRTPEIGVRMAMGARPADVLGLIARQAMVPLAGGVALGLAGTWALGRALASLLFGVRTGDPPTLAGAAFVLVMAGMAAAVIPARRAARVDPMTALRNE